MTTRPCDSDVQRPVQLGLRIHLDIILLFLKLESLIGVRYQGKMHKAPFSIRFDLLWRSLNFQTDLFRRKVTSPLINLFEWELY